MHFVGVLCQHSDLQGHRVPPPINFWTPEVLKGRHTIVCCYRGWEGSGPEVAATNWIVSI